MHIADLSTKGFVSLSYPREVRDATTTAIRSWKKFCSLPETLKKVYTYSNTGAGFGYELKTGEGPKGDRKENFDVTLAARRWLVDYADLHKNDAIQFIEDASALIHLVQPVVSGFAEQVEEAYGVEGLAKEVGKGESAYFIRFIHYPPGTPVGEEPATAHVDQSGFTLHLFESDPGLQCLTFDRQWIDMPVSSGETVIIPAMQLQLRSKGKLTALCHRVIATTETTKTGRYSAVCFMQLKQTPKYDKEANGRLQEKPPGFNYGMLHQQFQKFFK
jgi:isopenicillin N synthase-like dioxygenase